MNDQIIEQVESFVREEMEWLCAAHDFQHIERVVTNAIKIWEWEQKWDREIIIIWALLHESFDEKFFETEDMENRKDTIIAFLISLWISQQSVDQIIFIIENVWYWKSLERDESFQWSLEFQIVEDADRLEAIWAIAIARVFTYWGKKNRPMHDPNIQAKEIKTKQDYYTRSAESTSFNHFYEKLLLLRDMMHTETGKKIAGPRHDFMKLYVETFLSEWKWNI